MKVKTKYTAYIAISENSEQECKKYEIKLSGDINAENVISYSNKGASAASFKGIVLDESKY